MIPRKIHVGAHTYTVSHSPAAELGHTDGDNLRINISPIQAESAQRGTLLHECLHAVALDTGLKEQWGDHEEQFVRSLEGGLFALMRRNPGLVEYLMESE